MSESMEVADVEALLELMLRSIIIQVERDPDNAVKILQNILEDT